MDQLGSGGLPCPGGGVPYGSVDASVAHPLQHGDQTDAATRQQHQGSPQRAALQPLSTYPTQAGAPGAPSDTFVSGMGPPAASGAYPPLPAAAAETTPYHRTADVLEHFAPSGVVATEFHRDGVTTDAFHGVSDGAPLGPTGALSGDRGIRGATPPDSLSAAAPSEPASAAACVGSQEPHGAGGSAPGQGPEAGATPSSTQLPRVGEGPLDESTADRTSELVASAGHAAYHESTQDQAAPPPSCGGGPLPSGDSQAFGGARSGIEKYLQWLDAIHTACSKLDDLCSKLDRNFPNATREWDATSAGIRGARQLFQMYAGQQPTQVQHAAPGTHGATSLQEEIYTTNSRKRQRRETSNALGASGGLQGPQSSAGNLAHEFAGAAISMSGRGLPHMQQSPAGSMGTVGLGGAYGTAVVDQGMKQVAAASSLSTPLAQQCTSPLPGTANVLPPAEVPTTPSLADGGEYEYLLDYPEQEAPDPDNPSDLKCDVAGVYWDKRSWIASWYEGGKRYYKSFSAKTHGFYRSKYWAIKVRLSKVQSHALAGKGLKARATAA